MTTNEIDLGVVCEALGHEVHAYRDPEGWVAFRIPTLLRRDGRAVEIHPTNLRLGHEAPVFLDDSIVSIGADVVRTLHEARERLTTAKLGPIPVLSEDSDFPDAQPHLLEPSGPIRCRSCGNSIGPFTTSPQIDICDDCA